jgi:hypothetical protein
MGINKAKESIRHVWRPRKESNDLFFYGVNLMVILFAGKKKSGKSSELMEKTRFVNENLKRSGFE